MFKKIFAIIALAFTLCFTSTNVYAGDDSSKLQVSGSEQSTIKNSFDDTYKLFHETIAKSEETLKSASKNLFFALALISLVWNLSQTMMKGTEINSLLFDLVKFTLTVGFFYWLIEGVDTIIEPLFDKFGSFGASTFGGSANDVAGLIKFGTDTATQIFEFKGADTDTSLWDFDVFSWFLVFFQAGIALLVLFTTYIMAMNVTVAMIDFILCAYMGLFVLGFSGGSWMRESAMTYLKNLLAKCVKYYATIGIMVFCFDVMQTILKKVANSEFSFGIICVILMTFMVIIKVIESVPQSISSMIGNAGNTDVASASGIAKAGAMAAGAMAGGFAMKMAGRVGGNLLGIAGKGAGMAGGLAGKGVGIATSAFASSKVGQAIGNSAVGKGAHIAGAVAGAVGRGTVATAKAVFGNHSKNSAENKLDQIQNVLNK